VVGHSPRHANIKGYAFFAEHEDLNLVL